MIGFENTETYGWEAAIRGMRNPMNSWEKSDSKQCYDVFLNEGIDKVNCSDCPLSTPCENKDIRLIRVPLIGPNDQDLMMKLRNAGTDHRKFMRMIMVSVDITAPLYWWKEFDTYKVGTVANSCSTMHKITEKEFTLDDFSTDHLLDVYPDEVCGFYYSYREVIEDVIKNLNNARTKYIEAKTVPLKDNIYREKLRKKYWWQIIQLLPSSYNQKRTVTLNYEVLANIAKSRKNHKLDEWSIGFMNWMKSLPYSELIFGEEKE